MKSKIIALVIVLCALAGCEAPPVNRDASVPLVSAKNIDLKRYAGLWYEIARFPNSFETDCVGVTAQYTISDDGSIKVVNRCRKKTLGGPEDVAVGRARVVGDGKLAVTFTWPFEGDYWILDVAPDYSWALVGEPSGRYLWVLSRQPRISAELRTQLDAKLKNLGYNVAALYRTPQR